MVPKHRLDPMEECINKLEDSAVEIIQSDEQKEKRMKKE